MMVAAAAAMAFGDGRLKRSHVAAPAAGYDHH